MSATAAAAAAAFYGASTNGASKTRLRRQTITRSSIRNSVRVAEIAASGARSRQYLSRMASRWSIELNASGAVCVSRVAQTRSRVWYEKMSPKSCALPPTMPSGNTSASPTAGCCPVLRNSSLLHAHGRSRCFRFWPQARGDFGILGLERPPGRVRQSAPRSALSTLCGVTSASSTVAERRSSG